MSRQWAIAALTLVALGAGPVGGAEENRTPASEAGQSAIARGEQAPHRGVFELALTASPGFGNPYDDVEVQVTLTRPGGDTVTVDGFFDGETTWKARAYCDTLGEWRWKSSSNNAGLHGKSGRFKVVASPLPGKLRLHPDDRRQFAYDNGEWFLHIGDTGYRYVVNTEPKWQAYIDQAAQMGVNKVRTWTCRSRSGVEALFADSRRSLDLPYWREMERRLLYALERHPHVIFELIPFGEDTPELLRYAAGDAASRRMARYAQARFSALPNVYWCVVNDRIFKDAKLPRAINQIAHDMDAREPWGTLLTCHQTRFSGYAFVDQPWSDMVLLQDMDQVAGAILLEYREKTNTPVINAEDRYENHRPPGHPRYFFRRLMWGSLLSGGSATYGGGATYEAFKKNPKVCGVQGYYDLCASGALKRGGDDFNRIHAFFKDYRLTLVGMTPADELAGGDPLRYKCIRGFSAVIVYLANPTGKAPETDDESPATPRVALTVPAGTWHVLWFDPQEGGQGARAGKPVSEGAVTLTAPGAGDWILLLRPANPDGDP